MNTILARFASLAFIILLGCVWHPDLDENFKDVSTDVEIPPVQINLLDVGDTIQITGLTDLTYSIEGLDPTANFWVRITGEDIDYRKDGLTGTIQYGPDNKAGYEILTLQVYVKSGTGSLADMLNVEKIVFERSWVLSLDTTPPEDIFITSIGPDNGSLKIEWTPYTRANFSRFQITKIRANGIESYVIDDQNSNYFYDSSYVGGETLYRVSIVTQNGLSKTSPNETYVDSDAPALVEYEILQPISEPAMRMFFSASKYPANVARYEVYESAYANTTGQLILTTTNPTDTSFTLEPSFGRTRYVLVITFGKVRDLSQQEEVVYQTEEYRYGEAIAPYEEIFMAPQIDRFFTKTNNQLKGFSISTNAPAGTLTLPAGVGVNLSPLQDRVLGMNDAHLYIWDALTLTLTNEYDFSSLLGPGEHIFGFGLTKDNRLLLSRGTNSGGLAHLLIVDMASQTILNEYSGFRTCKLIEMADDNTAVRNYGNNSYNRITKIENGALLFVGVTAEGTDPLVFNPADQTQAIVGNNQSNKIIIRDIATLNIISEISTPLVGIYSIDEHAGVAGGFQTGTSYLVFDYVNQETRWSGKVDNYPTPWGDYLYSSEGVRLKFRE